MGEMLTPEILREIGISAGLFIFFWIVVGRLFFRPYFSVLEEREARTDGDLEEAAEKRRKGQEVFSQIEQHLAQARLEGLKIRDAQAQRAKEEGLRHVEQEARIAEEELIRGRQEIAQMKEKAQGEVRQEAERLAQVVRERVLAVEPGVTIH